MTKERLLEGILHLPTIKLGTTAEDDQKIEGNQGNVHYKMKREMVSTTSGGITFFLLAASGPEKKRLAFINEVAEELGPPIMVEELYLLPGIHFAIWKANEVEERLRKISPPFFFLL